MLRVLRKALCGSAVISIVLFAGPQSAVAAATLRLVSVQEQSFAGRTITANGNEVVQAMFADGTTLTLSPGSTIKIESYDPGGGGGGCMSMSVSGGNIRVSGGDCNEKGAITIKSGGATISLESGSAFVSTGSGETRVHLLNGKGLTVSGDGTAKRLYRPGFQVVIGDGSVSSPRKMTAEQVYADLATLNPGIVTRSAPSAVRSRASVDDGDTTSNMTMPLVAMVATNLENTIYKKEVGNTDNINSFMSANTFGELNAGAGFASSNVAGDVSYTANSSFSTSVGAYNILVQNTNVSPLSGQIPWLIPPSVGDSTIEYEQKYKRPVGPTANSIFSISNTGDTYNSFANIVAKNYFLPKIKAASGNGLQYSFIIHPDDFFVLRDLDRRPDLQGGTAGGTLWFYRCKGTCELITDDFGSFEYRANNYSPIIFRGLSVANSAVFDQYSISPGLGSFTDTGFLFTSGIADARTRLPDNFVAAGFRGAEGNYTNGSSYSIIPGSDFFFAAGDVDAAVSHWKDSVAAFSDSLVNRFYVSPGITDAMGWDSAGFLTIDQSKLSPFRAFARTETAVGFDVYDAGLYVVNPVAGAKSFSTPSVALHADMGGNVVNGQLVGSTISSTIGSINYYIVSNGGNEKGADAFAVAHTIGSTTEGSNASSVFGGDLRSTAAGGGNPAITSPSGSTQSGRAGYLVLENFADAYTDDSNSDINFAALRGGTEDTLADGKGASTYALLRMATAVKNSESYVRTLGGVPLEGYAAGFVEAEGAGKVTLRDFAPISATTAPNLIMTADGNLSTISGTLGFTNGSGKAASTKLGGSGDSAYVSDTKFGLQTSRSERDKNTNLALVSGELVAKGIRSGKGTAAKTGLAAIGGPSNTSYKYVQWGFFFGDVDATAGKRQHVALGSFATGKRTEIKNGATGTVSYSGHMVGNVTDGAKMYTAAGTYNDEFNFGSRKGKIGASFDGRKYSGSSSFGNGSYSGSMKGAGSFQGKLKGSFVGGQDAGGRPRGLVGAFQINDGKKYVAIGTFAADGKPK